jgi:outer membrane protein
LTCHKAGPATRFSNVFRESPVFISKEHMMKKSLLTLAALCALAAGPVQAQSSEGPWMVRVRAVQLQSANDDSTGLGLSINDKVIPEVDISYFFTRNIAAELVLTVPQKHTLNSTAVGGDIGTLKHLPPTLLLQYHFDAPGYKPYVGAGLNYTRFSSVNLTVAGADIERKSVGGALQVGVDIPLARNLYLNLDLKKVYIGTNVSLNGVKQGTFKVDPLLVGVGLGWRF